MPFSVCWIDKKLYMTQKHNLNSIVKFLRFVQNFCITLATKYLAKLKVHSQINNTTQNSDSNRTYKNALWDASDPTDLHG